MTDRVQMPQEFYDRVNPQLLVQPEPQYFYATMLLRALAAELSVPDELGHIGREIGGTGADYNNDKGTLMLQGDGISEEIFAAKVDFEGEPGHTVRFNRPVFENTTYTEASRQIKTNTTISTTPIDVESEQSSITLKRFAGPYDQTNSRVAPFPLDALDAQLGIHKKSKIVGLHMKRDFHKFLDSVMVTLADTGTAKYPTGFSGVNDFTLDGQYPLNYGFISSLERQCDDANMPTLPNGNRILVVSPAGEEALKTDTNYQRLSEFHKEKNALFPGTYFRTVGKFDCFKSTTLTHTTNTSSKVVYRGHVIAPGAFGIGMGKPPKVAYSNDDNYGETAKLIWLAYLAFAMFNTNLVYRFHYTDVST